MLPKFLHPVSKWFRTRRNAKLVRLIDSLHAKAARPVNVLDVGGSYTFWQSVANSHKCTITLINLEEGYRNLSPVSAEERDRYRSEVGDARDLSRWQDRNFDLVTCNSVIEHVGTWSDMRKAAGELRRVGVRGWVQVPAFCFPLEQHFLLPFVHWFSEPITTWLVWNLRRDIRSYGWDGVRLNVTFCKPLSKGELRRLFPGDRTWTEWLAIFPKSHIVEW